MTQHFISQTHKQDDLFFPLVLHTPLLSPSYDLPQPLYRPPVRVTLLNTDHFPHVWKAVGGEAQNYPEKLHTA